MILAVSCTMTTAAETVHTDVFLGIELIELAQNQFRNIGPDNITFLAGFFRPVDEEISRGARYQLIHADLSESHLKEPSPVYKGDFTGVTGKLRVHRFYADNIYRWDFPFLSIQPTVSAGAGYTSWEFTNSLLADDSADTAVAADTDSASVYQLHTITAGISGRFRFTVFQHVFIEIPVIDLFVFLYKDRTPEAFLGDAHIAFNEYFGAFNWICAGITIPIR